MCCRLSSGSGEAHVIHSQAVKANYPYAQDHIASLCQHRLYLSTVSQSTIADENSVRLNRELRQPFTCTHWHDASLSALPSR